MQKQELKPENSKSEATLTAERKKSSNVLRSDKSSSSPDKPAVTDKRSSGQGGSRSSSDVLKVDKSSPERSSDPAGKRSLLDMSTGLPASGTAQSGPETRGMLSDAGYSNVPKSRPSTPIPEIRTPDAHRETDRLSPSQRAHFNRDRPPLEFNSGQSRPPSETSGVSDSRLSRVESRTSELGVVPAPPGDQNIVATGYALRPGGFHRRSGSNESSIQGLEGSGSLEFRRSPEGSRGPEGGNGSGEGKRSSESSSFNEGPKETSYAGGESSEPKKLFTLSRRDRDKGKEVSKDPATEGGERERAVIEYSSPAREVAHDEKIEFERHFIKALDKFTVMDMNKGGISGQKEIVSTFMKNNPEYNWENIERHMPKDEARELIGAMGETRDRFAEIARKRISTPRDLYKNKDIPRSLLGDEIIKKSSVVEGLESLREEHRRFDNGPDMMATSDNLLTCKNYVNDCITAGKESFSSFIDLKMQVMNNAQGLHAYFAKYKQTTIMIDHHNSRLRRGGDFLVAGESAINGALVNFPLGEMTPAGRVAPLQTEVYDFSKHVPTVTDFYASLKDRTPELRPTELPETPLQKMRPFLRSGERAIVKNPKAANRVLAEVRNADREMGETTRPVGAFARINAYIDKYQSELLENSIRNTAKGAFAKELNAKYEKIRRNIGEIERYAMHIHNEGSERAPNLDFKGYEQDLKDYKAALTQFRLQVGGAMQNEQRDLVTLSSTLHDNKLFQNVGAYHQALTSMFNYIQKIGAFALNGAAGHAAGGFPNA